MIKTCILYVPKDSQSTECEVSMQQKHHMKVKLIFEEDAHPIKWKFSVGIIRNMINSTVATTAVTEPVSTVYRMSLDTMFAVLLKGLLDLARYSCRSHLAIIANSFTKYLIISGVIIFIIL